MTRTHPPRAIENMPSEEILQKVHNLRITIEGIQSGQLRCTSMKRTIQGMKAAITVFQKTLEKRGQNVG